MKINDVSVDYSNLPNFEALLNKIGINKTRRVFDNIERIRYYMYLVSYFKNDCVEISEINSQYDSDCAGLLKKPAISDIDVFLNTLHEVLQKVNEDCRNEFYAHFDTFVENQPDCCFNTSGEQQEPYDKDLILTYITVNRGFEWSKIFHRKFYNEVENPAIVDILLKYILNYESGENFSVLLYDFHDYEVLFKDKDSMDAFCDTFVECGTTFQRLSDTSDGKPYWSELYSF